MKAAEIIESLPPDLRLWSQLGDWNEAKGFEIRTRVKKHDLSVRKAVLPANPTRQQVDQAIRGLQ